jgi:hypothetical protein
MPHAKPAVSFAALCILIFCTASAFAQKQIQSVARYTNLALPSEASSRLTTLFALDPVSSSLCFADGQAGYVMQQGGVFNRCSNIEFDHYNAGRLTVGIQGGEEGLIVDLGTAEDLKKEYGYNETVPNGQGFASITFYEGKIKIRKSGQKGELQELREGEQFLRQPVQSSASATAKAGHIYLARIVDRHKKDFQILVKLLVLKAVAGDSVTFRWELL